MRIIGGEKRGLKLQPFAGMAIRPTADRLRESIFNILGPLGSADSVLDLFAGTGALGIEALSRGARSAVFIDHSAKAIALIQRNLAHARLAQRGRTIQWDIVKNLDCLQNIPWRMDLVFVDPPYAKQMVPPALHHLDQSHRLAANALIVVEHEVGEFLQAPAGPYRLHDRRRYGKRLVSFLQYML